MRAYVYCSYKFSPVGFQIGVVDYNKNNTDIYTPSKNNLDSKVISTFEQGFIAKMYGQMPDSGKYIYLIKKLQKNNILDPKEGEIDIYMNFAFEFDNLDEYKNFSFHLNSMEKSEISEKCSNFVIPDRNIEIFALKIDAKNFNNFIDEMCQSSNNDSNTNNNVLHVEVISSKSQEEKLKDIFGWNFEQVDSSKIYRYTKKTVKKNNSIMTKSNTETPPLANVSKILPIIFLIIIVLLIIFFKG